MIIARSASGLRCDIRLKEMGSVLTIGNFDGVHLGHQAMLAQAKSISLKYKLPLLVLSFDPHPEAYFASGEAPARLDSFAERVMLFKAAGVDLACIVPFNAALAQTSDQAFIEKVVLQQLNAKFVVVGDDFRYGTGRKGNVSSLIQAGKKFGFEVHQLDSVECAGARVSSTQIRELLGAGQFDLASKYLGRPYSIMGRVIHGDARGRTWGFPTLNLVMKLPRAIKGVFAVRIKGLGQLAQAAYLGVANLGNRPTVDGLKTLLEVHVFDYKDKAYGRRVCVEFCTQIRQEQKFDSFDALKAQIQLDTIAAKNYFKQLNND